MEQHRSGNTFSRVVSIVVQIAMLAAMFPVSRHAAAADTIQTLATSYQPTINETIDASGFKHPGVGITKDILENMRTEVQAQKEPWNTYFNQMLLSTSAKKTPTIVNVSSSDPTKPRYIAFNSQGVEGGFRSDALTAYTQALLYYVTGDETYRSNALRIIRMWSQMDPAQYAYYTDAAIHTGIALQRMTAAAEIIRYSSYQTASLAWTDDDTTSFTNNLVIPVIDTFDSCNCRFMNQHLYTTIAAMSGAIFMGSQDRYNKAVEWFTVNKDAVDQGQNGSIKQLFRLVTKNDLTGEAVTPAVQHVEMGRDQAHGAGDVTNAEILSRMMMAQGTKVDPVDGTISTAPNAVGPYEFLNDRILDAAELFGTFMQGKDIPWIPTASHTDAYGNPTVVYKKVADGYRGRLTQNTWELFYYYQYVRGVNMEQRAPNFTKIFAKRTTYNWDGGDGGGDFWLFIPKAAEAEGSKYLMTPIVDPYREVEDRFTPQDSNSVAMTDDTASFVRVTATSAGSKLAVYGYGYGASNIGFRVRTNGIATMDVYGNSVQLPDTKGQWRYVNVASGLGDYLPLTVTGNGTTVDIDHINIQASTLLTPPAFTAGSADLTVYTYAGSTLTTTLDFSATDASALTYQVDNLPAGASFDTATGAFSWKPTQAGTYSFVIEASDGSTISTKRVTIVVSTDRQATVNAVIAPYNPNTLYVTSTVTTYNAAYADMMSVIGSASDDVFFQKLATLRSAVAGLQQLTPLLSDGSVNYVNMFVSSTFGTSVPNLLDNNPDTFACFCIAQNLSYTMDFGPSFKISATAFGLQVRTSFPERLGGVVVFGSNDNANWTRLTPDETVVTEDMQTLAVQDDLKNNRYRFLMIKMIDPSGPLIEPGEFRIFGTRYETVNKLTSVSLGSDQALKNRIIAGNTVKLSFQSSEPINAVNATIQGQPATVTTTDNLNWTASAVISGTAPVGTVKFLLNYKTAAGIDAEPTLFTTDGSSLFIADQTGLISNLLDITTLSDSSGRNQTDLLSVVNNLFDSNGGTSTDFRVNGSGWGAWLEFDFRGGGTAMLSKVEILARQDQYYTRINGTVIQGSNDNATWTTISNAAGNTADWQTLKINDTTPYRYIRVFNGNQWFGNMSELRLYGTTASTAKIASASISSAQALRNRIVPGNTVKVAFTAKEAINNVTATIQGTSATVSTTDNINFTATATLPQGVAAGTVKFSVNYKTQDGKDGYPGTATTDGTSLNLVDESDVIKNVTSITTLIDSSQPSYHNAAATLSTTNTLFDGNLGTASDYRTGTTNSGWGAFITFDFKAGNQVNLTNVELIARQDQVGRIKGTVVLGSNDNTNWTTLTAGAAGIADWQTFAVSSLVPYRYIRVYNPNQWFGNMAELRFHGTVHSADTTAPVTTATAPQGTVGTDATVTFTATDNTGGSGIQATYYTVDGGAQQTGKSVTLTTDGTHTVAYWSVDWAGNTEQQKTVTVTIDKTAPALAGLYADVTAPTNGNVTVTVYYPLDAAVKEVKVGDSGAWTAYTAPVVVTDNTTVYARSADAVGNVSAIASYTVGNIYKVPPSGAVLAADVTDPTNGNVTVSITYPTTNVVLKQYKVGDSGAWTAYAGPVVVTDNTTVYAQSTDIAGNVSPVTSYAVSNIDRVPPADAALSADITAATNQNVTVTVTYPDDAAVKEYKLGDNGAWTAYGGPVVFSDNGTVFARSADAAGNVSNVTQYVVNYIDHTPPVPAALAVDTTAPTNQGVSVTIAWPDDAAVKEYKVGDSGEWTAYTAPVVVQDDTVVYARGTDAVGNVSLVTSIVVSNIYKVVPVTVATLNPAAPNGKNSWYTTDVSVNLAVAPGAYGGAVTTEYQVNAGAWIPYTGPIAFGEGTYTFGFRSRDEAGNVEQVKTMTFNVDKTVPALSVQLDKSTIWPPNHQMVPVNATLSSNDDGSGVDTVVLSSITSNKPDSGQGDIQADVGTAATSFSVRAEKDRIYTVTYTATDKAGNKTVRTVTVTVPHDQSGVVQ
jgi:large repetitive protein